MPNDSPHLYCKKMLAIFPSPAEMSLTKLSLAGINQLFPVRESLVSDIPARDRKTDKLFLQCIIPPDKVPNSEKQL